MFPKSSTLLFEIEKNIVDNFGNISMLTNQQIELMD